MSRQEVISMVNQLSESQLTKVADYIKQFFEKTKERAPALDAEQQVIIAGSNLPFGKTAPHKPKGKRRLGILAGRVEVPDDIMAEDEEINAMFYGQEEEGHS
ncbi:MAG: hypothetical protein D3914_08215 [Candidatus Electrothrix sp. LOE2]|nr:hypothetical protein [Candidatus Electrothrix sp. LOE2]